MRTLVFAVLAACGGGGHAAPQAPVEHPPPRVTKEPAQVAVSEAALADCERLFKHVVELDDHAGKLPDADRAYVRDQLWKELGTECMTKPRAIVLCGIDAPTSEAIAACDQPTPSSSTSNSSVAPPGITPAAPRSP